MLAEDLPPAPASGIWDDTRALTEAQQKDLSRLMADFRQQTGCTLWLTAGTYLGPSRTIRQHARELRQKWGGAEPSILLAYDRSGDRHGASLSPAVWGLYPSERLIHVMQETARIMQNKQQPVDQRLQASILEIIRQLTVLERQRVANQQVFQPAETRLLKVAVPALGVGALLLFIIGTLTRKRDVSRSIRHFFPECQVGQRLGAPFGGGVVVEPGSSSAYKP